MSGGLRSAFARPATPAGVPYRVYSVATAYAPILPDATRPRARRPASGIAGYFFHSEVPRVCLRARECHRLH